MKNFLTFILLISSSASAQIIDIEHPKSFYLPEIFKECYTELLKECGCLSKIDTKNVCLRLGSKDTLVVFFRHEGYYQFPLMFSYFKKRKETIAFAYYDKGYRLPTDDNSGFVEVKSGNVFKNYSFINDPICMKDLMQELEDSTLRMVDTTFFISHTPYVYISLYFGEKSIHRVAYGFRAIDKPFFKKLDDQLYDLYDKLPQKD